MARILCRDLTKRFGTAVVLDKLNLEIKDREFMVLLGPSGCGKTTTLNLIAGLEELSSGNLYFDDQIVNFMPPHQREVAMVFQSYALYPHKTVYDNIAFGLRLRSTPRDEIDRRVKDAARQLEIEHLLERRPQQISGGQRQRVALGRAIVRDPAVFLMDEPLSNLDAALRISMRTLIKKLHNRMQTTFVYVTHDQAEALTLADRIAVMRDGHIQQLATPDTIYNRPSNVFVATFLGSPQINLIEGIVSCEDGELVFERGAVRLALGKEWSGSLKDVSNREVLLGVRPEDAELRPSGTDKSTRFSARTLLVSSLGSESYVNAVVEGVEMVFRTDKGIPIPEGADVQVTVDPRRVHLFDKKTQVSLAVA